jgi:hypothetical protein
MLRRSLDRNSVQTWGNYSCFTPISKGDDCGTIWVMYLAIDIGGSKTLLATFSTGGKLHDSVKFKTPHDYPEFLKEIGSAFKELNPEGKLTAKEALR